MPLLVYKRPSRSHMLVILPISLVTTLTLIVALCYLQVLYAACFIARSFRASPKEFPPFKSTIERAEKWTVNIILRVIPSASHPRASASPQQQEPLYGPDFTIWNSRSGPNIPAPQANGFATPPDLPQYYEAPTTEAGPVQQKTNLLTPKKAVHRYGKNGSIVYDTVKKAPTNVPKLHAMINLNTLQPARSSPALRRQAQEHDKSTYHPAHMEISEGQYPADNLISGLLRVAQVSVASFDGPYDLAETVQPVVTVEDHTPKSDRDALKLGWKEKCQSTESYPGRFPVSDGQDMSCMATAEFAFRERGTTTARPFSDY
ncbi:hypothetical protein N7495_003678 [Penicillium taxi]|uniref:uncharacterized protein n=1 Tax=Penicillium taxi TaxID=168475 RepID=UPI002545AE14|nr:uncharacterized protein N7495_003678 [Penicillium taxi]KAJ5898934.1 hypothetical protein N7495_003678 [Penicillium taxi]